MDQIPSFFSKIKAAKFAIEEGRSTAMAHRLAEELLESKLPPDVGVEGYNAVAQMATHSTVDEMAMVFVTVYANRMSRYLPAVNATPEFRTSVARSVARACILLAEKQRSGAELSPYYIVQLTDAAKKHGVNTDTPRIAFRI